MMSLARFALACALCGYAAAGEVVHDPHFDDMGVAKDTFTSDEQRVRRLQGGYAQPGYGQGAMPYQNGGNFPYGQGAYQHGGSDKLSTLIGLLLPLCLLICLCLIVCQVVRCLCGGLCGDQMDPMLGAGLGAFGGYETGMGALPGAVAGYEAGRYMDGQGVDSAALGGLAGYEMGQYMGGPGGYGGLA